MPMARAIAAGKVAEGSPAAIAPKATPTARPSGILCRVIASTSRVLRLHFVLIRCNVMHFPFKMYIHYDNYLYVYNLFI